MNKTILLAILFSLSIFSFSQSFVTPTTPSLYISFIGCIFGGVLLIAQRVKRPTIGFSKSEGIFILFLTLFLVISSFQENVSPEYFLSGISLFLLYAVVRRIEINRSWLPTGFTLLGIVQAAYGLGQYLHWLPSYNDIFDICGSFDNPAGFAASLVVLFPFALQLIGEKPYYRKGLGVLGALMMIAAIVLSQSRSGMIAIAVVTGIWGYLCFGGNRLRQWRRGLKITVSAIAIIALVAGLYFLKKDSANGRLLIWQSSARMIIDKPLLGHGVGGFQREYMLYQADFFRHHTDSSLAMLADIVKHPFNEYLLLLVEQGITGALLFGAFIYLLVKVYRRKPGTEKRYAALSLIGVGLFACFSYPMNYPFVRMMAVFCAAVIMRDEGLWWTISRSISGIVKSAAIVLCLGLLAVSGKMCYDEYRWCDIAHRSLAGETQQVMPDYSRLYKTMRRNALFVYNYGAELNYIGEWEKSNILLQKCALLYNDIDLQLILADNYQQQGQFRQAERCLLLAHQMIPNRFIPLYRLALLYKETGRPNRARALAGVIIRKPIKIMSPEVMSIKAEMKELVR